MDQAERRTYLIEALLRERPSCRRQEIPRQAERQKVLLRGLMNVRAPRAVSDEFLQVQDAYLRHELAEAGITRADELTPVSGDEGEGAGEVRGLQRS